MARYRDFLIVGVVGMLLLMPFLHRPLFVDDHFQYRSALDLQNHWAYPYGNPNDPSQWSSTGPAEYNPPAYFYLVAGFTALVGDRPAAVHALFFLIQIGGYLLFLALARRLVKHALFATLLWMMTPHQWLTANSLLLDGLLAPFIVGGLYLWISGWSDNSRIRLFSGALFLSAAALVKYTGLLGWAAAILWTGLAQGRRWTPRWLFLLLPPFAVAATVLWTYLIYKQSHIWAAAGGAMQSPTVFQAVSLLSFLSATTWIMAAPGIGSFFFEKIRPRALIGLLMAAGLAAILPFSPAIRLALFFWMGLTISWAVFVTAVPKWDSQAVFLGGWIAMGLTGLYVARGWMCGKYLVIIGPAIVLLTTRVLETRIPDFFRPAAKTAVLLLIGVPAFLICWADQSQAKADVAAARRYNDRAAQEPAKRWLFPENTLSGLATHLSRQWKPVSPDKNLEVGDRLLIPSLTLSSRFYPRLVNANVIDMFPVTTKNPFRTYGSSVKCGYYGSIWGPLPFSVTRQPLEVYLVVESVGER